MREPFSLFWQGAFRRAFAPPWASPTGIVPTPVLPLSLLRSKACLLVWEPHKLIGAADHDFFSISESMQMRFPTQIRHVKGAINTFKLLKGVIGEEGRHRVVIGKEPSSRQL